MLNKYKSEFVWLFILLAILSVMGFMLFSGDILLYLAPRMVPMVWFGFFLLLVLFAYQILHIVQCVRERRESKPIKMSMLLFVVPVVLMLTVTPNDSTSTSLPSQSVKMLNLDSSAQTDTETDEAEDSGETSMYLDEEDAIEAMAQANSESEDEEAEEEETTLASVLFVETTPIEDLTSCILDETVVYFDQDSDVFSDYIYDTVDVLLDKTITLYGFVYYDDSFPDNMILVSRLYITCCVPDAVIVGFHVVVDDRSQFEEDEWIRVTGTIAAVNMEYYGTYYDFPVITAGIIQPCNTPDAEDGYLYP